MKTKKKTPAGEAGDLEQADGQVLGENYSSMENAPPVSMDKRKAMAAVFLKALDPTAKLFTYQFFDDDKSKPTGRGNAILHHKLADMWDVLVSRNDAGQGIFITVNETDLKGRSGKHITGIRCAYQEDDDGFVGKFPIEPSMVVESSPGKNHRYWLTDQIYTDAVGEARGVEQRLVDDYGSDPAAKDATRVLRLPGFYNNKSKYKNRPLVILKNVDGIRYSWDEIKGAFPPVEPPARKVSKQAAKAFVSKTGTSTAGEVYEGCRASMSKVGKALQVVIDAMDPNHQDPSKTGSYDEWQRITMILHNWDPGDRGLNCALQFGAALGYSTDADVDETVSKWLGYGRKEPEELITVGTLFAMAFDLGWVWTPEDELQEAQNIAQELVDKITGPARQARDSSFSFITIQEAMDNMGGIKYTINKCIPENSIVELFGPSENYKTFAAIDWACSVAAGVQWCGEDVKKGPVVYIAGEGNEYLARRVMAWCIDKGVDRDTVQLSMSTRSMGLTETDSIKEVINAVTRCVAFYYALPSLIIIDTLARNFGPGDENSTADMNMVINHLEELMSPFPGVSTILIHHTGLNVTERSRGSSSLRGAMDVQYSCNRKGAEVLIENTKMKDAKRAITRAFQPVIVDLGFQEDDGSEATSVVLKNTALAKMTEKTELFKKYPKLEKRKSYLAQLLHFIEDTPGCSIRDCDNVIVGVGRSALGDTIKILKELKLVDAGTKITAEGIRVRAVLNAAQMESLGDDDVF